MDTSPLLGILLYVTGGLAGASFYLPFKGVRKWAWETYWMIYTLAGLLIVPWALALAISPNVLSVLRATPWDRLGLCFLFGAMWGAGGLTWGLMIRYLGVGLGIAIGCGLCAAVGTLVPPVFLGEYAEMVTRPGGTTALAALIAGVVVSLVGIVVTGAAGMSKQRELSEAQKKAAVAEFHFTKGILLAIFSGVMSAGMSFGIRMGDVGGENSIVKLAQRIEPNTPEVWAGLPVLVVVLLGGFTVNFLWCLLLHAKNHTGGDYLKAASPILLNLLLAALAGAIWYSQLACYTMGDSQIGKYKFSGWSVFMSAQIVFSSLWGIVLLEWKGASARTRKLLAAGLVILVASMAIIAYGNHLKPQPAEKPPAMAR
ncbi:MAG: L-rhamnose/proton symporter RhaT [Thermoguttaceae bacterium]